MSGEKAVRQRKIRVYMRKEAVGDEGEEISEIKENAGMEALISANMHSKLAEMT